MRITRTMSFLAREATKSSLRKLPLVAGVSVFVVAVALVGQNFVSTPYTARAAVTPDSCFAFNSSTGRITNYYDNEANNPANPACPRDVSIPATIGGVTVTGVSTYGMSGKGLTALTIPPTLNSTGYAFAYNQIESIVIPEGITSIGGGAFRGNRLSSVSLPSTLTSIGDRAFTDNYFIADIALPPNLTTIGPRAFWGNMLTEVTIPASVTSIAAEAFWNNYDLHTIVFEGVLPTIGTNAFTPSEIQSVQYNGVTYTSSDPGASPEQCFAFDSGTGTITRYQYLNFASLRDGNDPCIRKDVMIMPSAIGGVTVRAIGNYPGFSSMNFQQLVLPSELVSIGARAFAYNMLTDVVIPDTVTTIGDFSFSDNEIASLTWGGNVQSIGRAAFDSNRLTTLEIPDTVTTIGNDAFMANDLTDVVFGSGLTSIGSSAFSSNKITEVILPSGLVSMGNWAFEINQIAKLELGDSLTQIPSSAFYANKITNVIIPNSVTTIHPTAFALQNPIGGGIVEDSSGPTYLWSSDPAVVQKSYDSIWYARLFTEDPANPYNLTAATLSEDWWWGRDANNNGHTNDSLGGHVVNQASVTVQYVSSSNNMISQPLTMTGVNADGSYITSYQTNDNVIMVPLDSSSPTPEEQATLQAGVARYFTLGQTVTITPPAIDGYVTPAVQTVTLNDPTTTQRVTYFTQTELDAQTAQHTLAKTGFNAVAVLIVAIVATFGGLGIVAVVRMRQVRLIKP